MEHQYRQNVFDLFTLCSHSCCGEYGHIYKPDRPISATDLQIKQVGQLEKKTTVNYHTPVFAVTFFLFIRIQMDNWQRFWFRCSKHQIGYLIQVKKIINQVLLLVLVRMGLFMLQKAFSDIDMEVWWTHTTIRVNSTVIDVNWTWGVVLAVDTPTDLVLHKADLDFMVS